MKVSAGKKKVESGKHGPNHKEGDKTSTKDEPTKMDQGELSMHILTEKVDLKAHGEHLRSVSNHPEGGVRSESEGLEIPHSNIGDGEINANSVHTSHHSKSGMDITPSDAGIGDSVTSNPISAPTVLTPSKPTESDEISSETHKFIDISSMDPTLEAPTVTPTVSASSESNSSAHAHGKKRGKYVRSILAAAGETDYESSRAERKSRRLQSTASSSSRDHEPKPSVKKSAILPVRTISPAIPASTTVLADATASPIRPLKLTLSPSVSPTTPESRSPRSLNTSTETMVKTTGTEVQKVGRTPRRTKPTSSPVTTTPRSSAVSTPTNDEVLSPSDDLSHNPQVAEKSASSSPAPSSAASTTAASSTSTRAVTKASAARKPKKVAAKKKEEKPPTVKYAVIEVESDEEPPIIASAPSTSQSSVSIPTTSQPAAEAIHMDTSTTVTIPAELDNDQALCSHPTVLTSDEERAKGNGSEEGEIHEIASTASHTAPMEDFVPQHSESAMEVDVVEVESLIGASDIAEKGEQISLLPTASLGDTVESNTSEPHTSEAVKPSSLEDSKITIQDETAQPHESSEAFDSTAPILAHYAESSTSTDANLNRDSDSIEQPLERPQGAVEEPLPPEPISAPSSEGDPLPSSESTAKMVQDEHLAAIEGDADTSHSIEGTGDATPGIGSDTLPTTTILDANIELSTSSLSAVLTSHHAETEDPKSHGHYEEQREVEATTPTKGESTSTLESADEGTSPTKGDEVTKIGSELSPDLSPNSAPLKRRPRKSQPREVRNLLRDQAQHAPPTLKRRSSAQLPPLPFDATHADLNIDPANKFELAYPIFSGVSDEIERSEISFKSEEDDQSTTPTSATILVKKHPQLRSSIKSSLKTPTSQSDATESSSAVSPRKTAAMVHESHQSSSTGSSSNRMDISSIAHDAGPEGGTPSSSSSTALPPGPNHPSKHVRFSSVILGHASFVESDWNPEERDWIVANENISRALKVRRLPQISELMSEIHSLNVQLQSREDPVRDPAEKQRMETRKLEALQTLVSLAPVEFNLNDVDDETASMIVARGVIRKEKKDSEAPQRKTMQEAEESLRRQSRHIPSGSFSFESMRQGLIDRAARVKELRAEAGLPPMPSRYADDVPVAPTAGKRASASKSRRTKKAPVVWNEDDYDEDEDDDFAVGTVTDEDEEEENAEKKASPERKQGAITKRSAAKVKKASENSEDEDVDVDGDEDYVDDGPDSKRKRVAIAKGKRRRSGGDEEETGREAKKKTAAQGPSSAPIPPESPAETTNVPTIVQPPVKMTAARGKKATAAVKKTSVSSLPLTTSSSGKIPPPAPITSQSMPKAPPKGTAMKKSGLSLSSRVSASQPHQMPSESHHQHDSSQKTHNAALQQPLPQHAAKNVAQSPFGHPAPQLSPFPSPTPGSVVPMQKVHKLPPPSDSDLILTTAASSAHPTSSAASSEPSVKKTGKVTTAAAKAPVAPAAAKKQPKELKLSLKSAAAATSSHALSSRPLSSSTDKITKRSANVPEIAAPSNLKQEQEILRLETRLKALEQELMAQSQKQIEQTARNEQLEKEVERLRPKHAHAEHGYFQRAPPAYAAHTGTQGDLETRLLNLGCALEAAWRHTQEQYACLDVVRHLSALVFFNIDHSLRVTSYLPSPQFDYAPYMATMLGPSTKKRPHDAILLPVNAMNASIIDEIQGEKEARRKRRMETSMEEQEEASSSCPATLPFPQTPTARDATLAPTQLFPGAEGDLSQRLPPQAYKEVHMDANNATPGTPPSDPSATPTQPLPPHLSHFSSTPSHQGLSVPKPTPQFERVPGDETKMLPIWPLHLRSPAPSHTAVNSASISLDHLEQWLRAVEQTVSALAQHSVILANQLRPLHELCSSAPVQTSLGLSPIDAVPTHDGKPNSRGETEYGFRTVTELLGAIPSVPDDYKRLSEMMALTLAKIHGLRARGVESATVPKVTSDAAGEATSHLFSGELQTELSHFQGMASLLLATLTVRFKSLKSIFSQFSSALQQASLALASKLDAMSR